MQPSLFMAGPLAKILLDGRGVERTQHPYKGFEIDKSLDVKIDVRGIDDMIRWKERND